MRAAAATALLLAAVSLGACSAGGGSDGDPSLAVYVSLPLRGPAGADGRDAADGARMALADANGEAAGIAVTATYLDDTAGAGERARWSPVQAAANARRAAQDSTAIAFLGDFASGATRASLPITNTAGLPQVSPASGAGDLISPSPSSDDVPDVQPSGARTFARVIPSDRAQAEAGAGWVDDLGVRRVATDSDGTPYGDAMVDAFDAALRRAVAVNASARLLYFAGEPANQPAALARTVPRLLVTDAELEPGVGEAPGTLATSAALDPSQLPPAGEGFAAAFESEYGRPPGRYAAYGYEAMAVILAALEAADDATDRLAVADAIIGLERPDSILGPYEITPRGETTLDRMTGYEFQRGGAVRPTARIGTG